MLKFSFAFPALIMITNKCSLSFITKQYMYMYIKSSFDILYKETHNVLIFLQDNPDFPFSPLSRYRYMTLLCKPVFIST